MIRTFRKTPALSLAALACIALGIGSAVFIFTLTHGVLTQRLPFPDAGRLLRIWNVHETTNDRDDLSYLDWRELREQARSFDAIEIAARTRLAVVTEQGTERMRGEAVSGGYFAIAGIKPAQGRLFTAAEYAPNGARVAVISHEMWQEKYGGRADILGRTLRARGYSEGRANEELRTIVGVMPPGFAGTVDEDISHFWIPVEHYAPGAVLTRRGTRIGWVMARLRPGVPLAAAQEEISRIGRSLAAQHPEVYEKERMEVEPVGERWREQFRTGLLMLMAASGLLLLIASTNIANLLLARLAQREQELTVRMALGAARSRIVRQLLTESLVLSAAGGALGIAAALIGVKAFLAKEVIQLPRYVTITPDARVIAVALALVVVTGILFGVVPAWLGSRVEISSHLRDSIRGGTQGRRQRRFGQALVVAEVAFTVVLLVASALMLRTYRNLTGSDLGFRKDNLLRMAISLDASAFADANAQLAFVERAKEQLGAYPGVRKVAFVQGTLPPWPNAPVGIAVNGQPVEALAEVSEHPVDRDFFDVLGIRLLRGRVFNTGDRTDGPRVAIVSRRLARAIRGGDGTSAVGTTIQRVNARELSAPIEIVGIVDDVRYGGPIDNRAVEHDLYIPLAQDAGTVLSLALVTDVEPSTLIAPMQRELGKLAPSSPVHWISTMQEELANESRDARLYAWLSAIFGLSALGLAVIGIYGVLANSVSRRYTELGVRMALGAQRADIAALVLRQGMTTLLAGLALGAILAAATTRLLRSLLFGIAPSDPISFAAVAIAILVSGAIACWLPARRATKLEPMVVLRSS